MSKMRKKNSAKKMIIIHIIKEINKSMDGKNCYKNKKIGPKQVTHLMSNQVTYLASSLEIRF